MQNCAPEGLKVWQAGQFISHQSKRDFNLSWFFCIMYLEVGMEM
jgi:hypothetical protein